MKIASVFWILVLALIFYIGFKVVPIYYKGIFGIRGVCKENAEVYHKYGRGYVQNGIAETLTRIGIPKDKSEFTITQTDNTVVVWIYYGDKATFFDRYTKEFEFEYECEGPLKTVY